MSSCIPNRLAETTDRYSESSRLRMTRPTHGSLPRWRPRTCPYSPHLATAHCWYHIMTIRDAPRPIGRGETIPDTSGSRTEVGAPVNPSRIGLKPGLKSSAPDTDVPRCLFMALMRSSLNLSSQTVPKIVWSLEFRAESSFDAANAPRSECSALWWRPVCEASVHRPRTFGRHRVYCTYSCWQNGYRQRYKPRQSLTVGQ
jgi:hypothetical protein